MKPVYTADLSPWARVAVKDAIDEALPLGYRITGSVTRYSVSLNLYGPRWAHLADRRIPVGSAPAAYRSLVDLAWIDSRERSVTVTTDAEGYITSITEGHHG